MRKAFPKTVLEIMEKDERVVVLLGDIGVFAFKDVFAKYPTRCFNMGICEQSLVGMAAGLSMAGFIPIVHTIEPFLVERAFEQIKIDFGYQELKGNLVGVNVEPTAPNLGYTHQCPYALDILKNIKGMKLHEPTDAQNFSRQLSEDYDKGLNYFRIS